MKKLVTSVLALSLLTGCATYQVCALEELEPEYFTQVADADGVTVGCKAFTKADCRRYFDRNVLAKGYQPIQLSFQNKSGQSYYFSTVGLTLPIATPDEVADSLHVSAKARVLGYTLGGVVLSPLAVVGFGAGAIVPQLLFTSGIVDGIKSVDVNARLDKDFCEKSADQLTIAPWSTRQTVLFVPCDKYRSLFDLTLVEEGTNAVKTVEIVAK